MNLPRILHFNPASPDPETIKTAVSALKAGELIVFPTDTVYGLAADPTHVGAIEKIYVAKGRPANKPVTFFVEDLDCIKAYQPEWSQKAMALADHFWPGPMTLVLKTSGGLTGFRIPKDPLSLAILSDTGPLAVTSANKSGERDACTAQDAFKSLSEHIGLVLDGGDTPGGEASTVIKVVNNEVEIVRHGVIKGEEVQKIVHEF